MDAASIIIYVGFQQTVSVSIFNNRYLDFSIWEIKKVAHVWPLNYGSFSPTVGRLRTQRAFVSRCVVVAPLLYSHRGYQAWNWTQVRRCIVYKKRAPVTSRAKPRNLHPASCQRQTAVPVLPAAQTSPVYLVQWTRLYLCKWRSGLDPCKQAQWEIQIGQRHILLASAISPDTSV